MTSKANKTIATGTLLVNEDLRRKHIRTLEVCQQLLDENNALKVGTNIETVNNSRSEISACADPNELELIMLRTKICQYDKNEMKLTAAIKDQERNYFSARTELESEQALRKIDSEKHARILIEKNQQLEQSESVIQILRKDNEKFQVDLKMKNDIINQFRTTKKSKELQGNITLQSSDHSNKEENQYILNKQEQILIEQLKNDVRDLRAKFQSDSQKSEQRISQLDKEVARLEHEQRSIDLENNRQLTQSQNEQSRLQAENAALQVEVQRLSKLLSRLTHSKSSQILTKEVGSMTEVENISESNQSLNNDATGTTSSQTSPSKSNEIESSPPVKQLVDGSCDEVPDVDIGGVGGENIMEKMQYQNGCDNGALTSSTMNKKQHKRNVDLRSTDSKIFAEFVALKRENQLLKLQINGMKKSHKQTYGLTKKRSSSIGSGL